MAAIENADTMYTSVSLEFCHTVKANAAIAREILEGRPGPKRDIVVANAAAALVAASRAEDFRDGAKLAAESIDSGKALNTLEEFVRFTNQFS